MRLQNLKRFAICIWLFILHVQTSENTIEIPLFWAHFKGWKSFGNNFIKKKTNETVANFGISKAVMFYCLVRISFIWIYIRHIYAQCAQFVRKFFRTQNRVSKKGFSFAIYGVPNMDESKLQCILMLFSYNRFSMQHNLKSPEQERERKKKRTQFLPVQTCLEAFRMPFSVDTAANFKADSSILCRFGWSTFDA